jgi:hypothetical protein
VNLCGKIEEYFFAHGFGNFRIKGSKGREIGEPDWLTLFFWSKSNGFCKENSTFYHPFISSFIILRLSSLSELINNSQDLLFQMEVIQVLILQNK